MKKTIKFIIGLLVFIPGFVLAQTVTTVEGLLTALADSTISEVKLGSDLVIDVNESYNGLLINGGNSMYNFNVNVNSLYRTFDLNGHTLELPENTYGYLNLNSTNDTFTITDTDGEGLLKTYENFLKVMTDSDDNTVELHDFAYENTHSGTAMILPDSKVLGSEEYNTIKMNVQRVDFYYQNNSPLCEGFDLNIKSLNVYPKNQNNPIGFYNDDSTHYLSDVVDPKSNIYLGDTLVEDDRATTLARDVFVGDNSEYGIKIIETYDVTFNTRGGDSISAQNIERGKKVNKPSDPSRENYDFVNWYTDELFTQLFNFETEINKDYNLYARWGKHFTVSPYDRITNSVSSACGGIVDSQSSTLASSYETVLAEESTRTVTVAAKNGYKFVGWTKDDPNGEIFSTNEAYIFNYSNSVGGNYYAIFDKVVSKITVSGIVKPVAGHTPNTNVTTSTPGVNLNVAWYDEATNQELKSTDKFVAKKKYYIRIEPSLDLGYVFSDTFAQNNANFEYNNPAALDVELLDDPTIEIRLHYEATEVNTAVSAAPSVKVKNANNNTLLVSWNYADNATKYVVYSSTDSKKWTTKGTVTTNSYTDKGLVYGKKYYYKVKAVGPKNSKTSAVANGKTIPNKVVLKIKSASTNNVKLSWNKVSVNGYEVWMGTKTSGMKKIKTITTNKTLTLNKTKLKANTKYYFKVRAYKIVSGKKVYGTWSDILSTKTAPKVATVSFKQSDSNLTVTINKSAGASKHEYAISEKKDFKLGIEAGVQNNSSIIPSTFPIKKGKTYYVKVRSCNSENRCSAWKVYSKETKK